MRIITLIMAMFIWLSSSISCLADTKNVKNYSFDKDIKMSGVISSTDKFFNVEDNWTVEDAKINLVLTKSELLDIDYSTVTVLINDTPISSEKLDGNKEYKKELSISIPKDLIQNGYNKITVKAYKTISDVVCRDDANTANWLVIHKESNIDVQYSYKSVQNILSQFNNTYLKEDNGSRLTTSILVPDNYSSAELSAGMIFSANFGENKKYDDFSFEFNTYSNLKNKNDNIIFIGKGTDSPTDILKLFNDNEKSLLNDNCIIKQVESPFNKDSKMLIIMSNDDELLIKGSKLITSNDLIKNLNQSSIVINKNNDINDLVSGEGEGRIYLKDLGYENLIVKGPFTQEIILDLNIPKDKVVAEGSKIKFDIRYAENLDFDRSLMTVYLNDTPIGSKRLYIDKADNDTFEATIPSDLLGKSYYQVKVAFDLNVKDLQCVTRDVDNPWAYIVNTSYIQFDYEDNNELTFSNYPYPFVLDDNFNDLKIIVPDIMTSTDLNNISNIVSFMGRDTKYNLGNIEIIKASEFNKNDNKSNIIIYGTPNTNNILKDINSKLNLKFNDDFSGFESNEKIKFIGEYSSQIASIQLIKSPYNSDFGAMVITATDNNDLNLAEKYLNDLSLTKSLKGDTVVIDRNGSVEDLYYNIEEKVDEVANEKVQTSKAGTAFIIVAVGVFITMTIVVIMMIKKYRK